MPSSTSPRNGANAFVRLRRTVKAALYSGPGRDRWQQPHQVIGALGLTEGMRVADVGAGGGYFTYKLARAVGPTGRVYAVDTDADMRALIEERAADRHLDTIVTVAPPDADPALPEPVDLALIVDAFHHLPEPPAYLRSLARHLRPGGRVAVLEPPPRWWLFGHATDPSLVRAALTASGYGIEAEYDFLPRQAFVVARPEE